MCNTLKMLFFKDGIFRTETLRLIEPPWTLIPIIQSGFTFKHTDAMYTTYTIKLFANIRLICTLGNPTNFYFYICIHFYEINLNIIINHPRNILCHIFLYTILDSSDLDFFFRNKKRSFRNEISWKIYRKTLDQIAPSNATSKLENVELKNVIFTILDKLWFAEQKFSNHDVMYAVKCSCERG